MTCGFSAMGQRYLIPSKVIDPRTKKGKPIESVLGRAPRRALMIECSLCVSIPMLVVVGLVGLLALLPDGADIL
jgi:hypothetical protein